MWIENIELSNFRNYTYQKIELEKGINVFYGENAQGKTNIVEAIFLTSFGKSFRTKKDIEMIKFEQKQFEIETNFHKSDRNGNIRIELGDKKNIYLNKIKIKKLSQLLGNINIVMFSPDDINMLKGGPENRRKFLNIMISQLRPKYMYVYNLYMKTLEERNNFLKKIKFNKENMNLLEVWNEQLVEYSNEIAKYRAEFVNKIKSKIENNHKNISKNKEKIDLVYNTDCLDKNNYSKSLKEKVEIDINKGYTTKGIHRDDFNIFINGKNINIYGSQGQRRSAILSLKMSELQVIYDEIGENPILLLDDFMSELDESRRNNFIENIKDLQVIITCTDKLLLKNLKSKNFFVKDGQCFEKNI